MIPTRSDSVLAELIDTYQRDALAPQHFFQTWQQAVLLDGPVYFGNGKRASATAARDKWELRPNVPLIESGGRLLRRVGVNGLADFGVLDMRRRTLVANLIIHYSGW